VSIRVPPALKIFAVPEPLKELRVEPKVMPEVPRISADRFPVESKTKFFILNVYGGVPPVERHARSSSFQPLRAIEAQTVPGSLNCAISRSASQPWFEHSW